LEAVKSVGKAAFMQFAILEHHRNGEVHWDLMLERPSGKLETWALRAKPGSPGRQSSVHLPPHRRVYLQYEGPILPSRGFVRRWDRGTYRIALMGDSHIVVFLAGRRLTGTMELREGRDDEWSVQFTPWAGRG
jgi:hypothetical protein